MSERRSAATRLKDVAYRTYVSAVLSATDRRAFDLATLRFIATLRNGHTQFFDAQADGRPLKFRLLEIENQWVVVSSQDSGLRRGSIVQTIDGKPSELAQYVAASNDRLACISEGRHDWESLPRCVEPARQQVARYCDRCWSVIDREGRTWSWSPAQPIAE